VSETLSVQTTLSAVADVLADPVTVMPFELRAANPAPTWKSPPPSAVAIITATAALAPLLKSWGAASTYADAILFFGSLSAQILMVYQKFESWIIWLIVDAGYVALYATQGLLFTSLLYVAFTILAALGWGKWYAAHRSATRSM